MLQWLKIKIMACIDALFVVSFVTLLGDHCNRLGLDIVALWYKNKDDDSA